VRAKYAAIEAEERRLARVVVTVPAGAPGAGSVEVRSSVEAGAIAMGGTLEGVANQAAAGPGRAGPEPGQSRCSVSALDFLARPDGSCSALERLGVSTELPAPWIQCLEVRVRYRGYIERQVRTAERAAAMESAHLPESLWSSRDSRTRPRKSSGAGDRAPWLRPAGSRESPPRTSRCF